MGLARAGHDLARGLVAPHGVDGDRERQSTSIAWRPLYQPQFGHTTWGSFARRHWGQRLCAGADSDQAEARLLLLLDFEVFFFGTAMALFLLAPPGAPAPGLPARAPA